MIKLRGNMSQLLNSTTVVVSTDLRDKIKAYRDEHERIPALRASERNEPLTLFLTWTVIKLTKSNCLGRSLSGFIEA